MCAHVHIEKYNFLNLKNLKIILSFQGECYDLDTEYLGSEIEENQAENAEACRVMSNFT